MSEFTVNMRDMRFNLFDWLDVGQLTKFERFEDYDAETMGDVLDACQNQAIHLLAPLNESADTEGLRVEDGVVKMPKGFKKAYDEYCGSGWIGLSHRPEHHGAGFPFVLNAAVQEIFTGANISFLFTPGLTQGSVGLIAAFGNDEQKKLYVENMMTGKWSGTMALTEPQAGTAVPDLKTAAFPLDVEAGRYKMKGQKIFISSGSQDMTENIVQMVLARVDGDPPGSRGVSLFIVPSVKVNADGSLGGSNDVTLMGIEHKLGIHASPTCALSFGDNDDCEGWLIGGQGNGLRCMFQMMNEARISVGIQGVGLAAASYEKALAYAKQRVQGVRIQDMRKQDAERVAIIEHPDVRRNLMMMKSLTEGARALVLYTAYCADRMECAADEKEAKVWSHQLEVMVPIVKAWCSDEGFKVTELGIQVHGGYGYCKEYGVEQYMRDAKIASLYEGTNGVQALDLLGRKVARGGGVMLMTVLNEINKILNGPAKEGTFKEEVETLCKSRDAVAQTAMDFGQRMMKGDMAYAALHATPFLQMFGDVLVGWLLLSQAIKAEKMYRDRLAKVEAEPGNDEIHQDFGQILEDDAEARFLHGKVQTAQFFIHQVVPRVRARRASIKSADRSALDAVL